MSFNIDAGIEFPNIPLPPVPTDFVLPPVVGNNEHIVRGRSLPSKKRKIECVMKKNPLAPKRPRSAYVLYCLSIREEVKESLDLSAPVRY